MLIVGLFISDRSNAQNLFLEAGVGIHINSYKLQVGHDDQISHHSPPGRLYLVSGSVQISQKFELDAIFSRMEGTSVQFSINDCNCSFEIAEPGYNELGIGISYIPFNNTKLTPFASFQYVLHFPADRAFGVSYMDSINGYQYAIANVAPKKNPSSLSAFQSVGLALGGYWKINELISFILRASVRATASRSPMHTILLDFESPQNRINDILYHTGLQPRVLLGLRVNLSEI